MGEESVPVQSEKGKAILAHAFNEGDCVLEFKDTEDGLIVMDITEHVEQLERKVDNDL